MRKSLQTLVFVIMFKNKQTTHNNNKLHDKINRYKDA